MNQEVRDTYRVSAPSMEMLRRNARFKPSIAGFRDLIRLRGDSIRRRHGRRRGSLESAMLLVMDSQAWDARYAGEELLWSAEPNRPEEQIVWDVIDFLPTCFRGCFTGQRRPDSVLRTSHGAREHERDEKCEACSADRKGAAGRCRMTAHSRTDGG